MAVTSASGTPKLESNRCSVLSIDPGGRTKVYRPNCPLVHVHDSTFKYSSTSNAEEYASLLLPHQLHFNIGAPSS